MDERMIQQIDSNNTKAMDEQNETVYFPALAEAALNFLEMNSGIFSKNC